MVTLGAIRDNTLYESADGRLSNGAGDHIFAGSTGAGDVRRGWLAFDISGSIPAGSLIESVAMTLHVSRTVAGEPSGHEPIGSIPRDSGALYGPGKQMSRPARRTSARPDCLWTP